MRIYISSHIIKYSDYHDTNIMLIIKYCDDALRIIASYLSFDEKVVFGNLCDVNFLNFYDFANDPEFRLYDNILCVFALPVCFDPDILFCYKYAKREIIEKYFEKEIKNEDNDLPYAGILTDVC